jgi:hypothetical protein
LLLLSAAFILLCSSSPHCFMAYLLFCAASQALVIFIAAQVIIYKANILAQDVCASSALHLACSLPHCSLLLNLRPNLDTTYPSDV